MTSLEAVFDRDSSLFVARGLYILRYQFGAADSEHPVAAAAPAPGFEDVIQVISEPGSAEGQLEHPGSVALVRAADNGKLRIGVRRRSSNGSLDAAFKLESVGISSDDKLAAVHCERNRAARAFSVLNRLLPGIRMALTEPCSWRTCPDVATCRLSPMNGLAVPMLPAASKGWSSWDLARRASRSKRKCCPAE